MTWTVFLPQVQSLCITLPSVSKGLPWSQALAPGRQQGLLGVPPRGILWPVEPQYCILAGSK